MRTLLFTTAEAARNRDAGDGALLHRLADDRGALMERLRRTHSTETPGLGPQRTPHLFYLMQPFGRAVWHLRQ